jgi:hypothetical protein
MPSLFCDPGKNTFSAIYIYNKELGETKTAAAVGKNPSVWKNIQRINKKYYCGYAELSVKHALHTHL